MKKPKPDAAERIAQWSTTFPVALPVCHKAKLTAKIRRAIKTAVRKERERCMDIAEAHKDYRSDRRAPFVIDDIIEEINRP